MARISSGFEYGKPCDHTIFRTSKDLVVGPYSIAQPVVADSVDVKGVLGLVGKDFWLVKKFPDGGVEKQDL
ncbi:hypothetical protein FPSE_08274 [Fusarium pseudograminearum CS3096]|uniref:Uncharacterized protein n=1 Tax=Fusarium pseudograminearum (strain CS3096) TaxID=1028729 RepID=K3VFE3_FUSPC|nr:hypothetical protein FPSE_08274 [Fusarium pseudograminearum CS3096]EKJ71533.1 hypothetical protein FPSE_08274 [Fusarium pseudograminearum CS3096]